MLKKKTLQTGEEGMRYSERPEIKQEGSPKTRTPKETGPLRTKWRQALNSPVRRGQEGKERRERKAERTDPRENIKRGETDAHREEGKELQDNKER